MPEFGSDLEAIPATTPLSPNDGRKHIRDFPVGTRLMIRTQVGEFDVTIREWRTSRTVKFYYADSEQEHWIELFDQIPIAVLNVDGTVRYVIAREERLESLMVDFFKRVYELKDLGSKLGFKFQVKITPDSEGELHG